MDTNAPPDQGSLSVLKPRPPLSRMRKKAHFLAQIYVERHRGSVANRSRREAAKLWKCRHGLCVVYWLRLRFADQGHQPR